MYKEDGTEMTEMDLLCDARALMADVISLLYETESAAGNSAAWMADSLLKYLQVVICEDDLLSASIDYQAYEERKFREHEEKSKESNIKAIK